MKLLCPFNNQRFLFYLRRQIVILKHMLLGAKSENKDSPILQVKSKVFFSRFKSERGSMSQLVNQLKVLR